MKPDDYPHWSNISKKVLVTDAVWESRLGICELDISLPPKTECNPRKILYRIETEKRARQPVFLVSYILLTGPDYDYMSQDGERTWLHAGKARFKYRNSYMAAINEPETVAKNRPTLRTDIIAVDSVQDSRMPLQ